MSAGKTPEVRARISRGVKQSWALRKQQQVTDAGLTVTQQE
ncbi:hypothetical protein ACFVGN_29135 [Streptomyces sp. NPDC057757]